MSSSGGVVVEVLAGSLRSYCHLVEERIEDENEWMKSVLHALASVYSSALQFCDLLDATGGGKPIGTEREVSRFNRKGIERALGSHRRYRFVFSPIEEDPVMVGDVASDLEEVYDELRPCLSLIANDSDALPDALEFPWHWGHHALAAMRALHELVHPV